MKVKAKWDFKARNENELTIQKGDIIIVVEKDADGWWSGALGGKEGLFPANYAEPYEEVLTPRSLKVDSTRIKPSIRKLQSSCGFVDEKGVEAGSRSRYNCFKASNKVLHDLGRMEALSILLDLRERFSWRRN